LRCIAYDPIIKESSITIKGGDVAMRTLTEVLASSHIVSLHLPLLPETKGLLNQALLDQMQEGAYLINTARGGIVDDHVLPQLRHQYLPDQTTNNVGRSSCSKRNN
ncbi:MAG: hypothetical protein EBU56_08945, partial [Burkholderiaceae bacterium]|nr:hypothetical protein [Burkholderiaceae bacterium]